MDIQDIAMYFVNKYKLVRDGDRLLKDGIEVIHLDKIFSAKTDESRQWIDQFYFKKYYGFTPRDFEELKYKLSEISLSYGLSDCMDENGNLDLKSNKSLDSIYMDLSLEVIRLMCTSEGGPYLDELESLGETKLINQLSTVPIKNVDVIAQYYERGVCENLCR